MSTPEIPRLSVVIPAFNEEPRLPATLDKLEQYFARVEYPVEVIVVDDGSSDGTADLVRARAGGRMNLQLGQNPGNMGKGVAVRRGMTMARGQYRLFFDADGSTPIEEVEKFYPAFAAGADVCIGSRALPESQLVVPQPWHRVLMGRVFNGMVSTLVVGGFRDTQCGFKGFSARAAELIFPRQQLHGFGFDVELLYIAKTQRLTVKEIPVVWIASPASRVRAFRDARRMFVDLLRIRRHAWRGRYR